MSQQELLKAVAGWLDGVGRQYFLTGSVASSLQGEPRATHDLDVAVWITENDVDGLAKEFPWPVFLLERETALDAIRTRKMFSLLEVGTGMKVDFWVVPDEPFNRSRLVRRQRVEAFGFSFWVSSPEDTILAKLRWAELSGGSEKQFRDALRIFEVQGSGLDQRYLDEWAAELGVTAGLQRLRQDASPA